MRDSELYDWIEQKFSSGDSINRSDVSEQFGEQGATYGRRMFDVLQREGLIEEDPDQGYYATDPDDFQRQFDRLFTDTSESGESYVEEAETESEESGAEQTTEEKAPSSQRDAAVISIPSEFRKEFQEEVSLDRDFPVVTLRNALKQTLSEAEDCVRLSVPYLETDGMNLLQTELDRMAEDNVNLKILTRGVYDPMSYEWGRAKDLRALYQLVNRYESRSEFGLVTIRDLQNAIRVKSGDGETKEKLKSSVHLKAAIADEKMVYVGSGEVRDSSMYNNLEGGTLSQSTNLVQFWKEVFDFFFERGEHVNPENLME